MESSIIKMNNIANVFHAHTSRNVAVTLSRENSRRRRSETTRRLYGSFI